MGNGGICSELREVGKREIFAGDLNREGKETIGGMRSLIMDELRQQALKASSLKHGVVGCWLAAQVH
jgi:hypothetical protein